MERITYRDLKATFPEEKKSVEAIYGRIVPVRKLSYWFTIPLINNRITAFQASIISMFIAVLACVFISVPNSIVRVIGVYLVPIWHIFDCVDGNIARYRKTASDFGSAVDAICGYFISAFLPLALGIASYNILENYLNWNPVVFIIFGGIGSISNILMRLIHQKYAFEALSAEIKNNTKYEKGDNQYTLTGFHRIRKMVTVEMGVVGIPMFVLLVAPFFNCYHILAFYYGVFNAFSLIIITFYYLRKCDRANGTLVN